MRNLRHREKGAKEFLTEGLPFDNVLTSIVDFFISLTHDIIDGEEKCGYRIDS